MELLSKGLVLRTSITKSDCKIIEFIGSGGQGEVYRALYNKREVALKFYYKNTGTDEQRKILDNLIKVGAPNNKFLWPIEVVERSNGDGFGYIMELRPKEYKIMIGLMKRKIEPTFDALIIASVQLADSFLKLHAKGLCYRDISYNNLFFNPDTGDILICDNDNVTYDNIHCNTILGTPKFMAPEVVVKKSLPNQYTDLYSMAILLFYLLFVSHPLEGELEYNIKCLDVPAMNKLYGSNPVFIFDPNNSSNRPVPGVHNNALEYWDVYPQFIKNAFIKAFTDGIKDAENGRVRESIWRTLLFRLKNSILYCSKCGSENFYDVDVLKNTGKLKRCWSCKSDVVPPPRIKIDNNIVMLNHNTRLYMCHINDSAPIEFTNPIAQIVQHPQNPNIWGLRNLTDASWYVTLPDGEQNIVPKGKSQTIASGVEINFGTVSGVIKN